MVYCAFVGALAVARISEGPEIDILKGLESLLRRLVLDYHLLPIRRTM